MAFLVSILGFSFPISASTPTTLFFKERKLWKFSLASPARQLSYRTATKISTSCNTPDAILILSRISGQHGLTPLRHQHEVASCRMSVGFSTQTVFSGYWVGPDVDDGWGFVEAFVNRI